MPVVVEDHQYTGALSGTSLSISTSYTPNPSGPIPDCAILVIHQMGTQRTYSGMAGLGGSWTQLFASSSSNHAGRQEVWLGTGINASGSVTATASGTQYGRAELFIISGLANPSNYYKDVYSPSSGTATFTADISAGEGQFVLAAICQNGSASTVTIETPATGWTSGHDVAGSLDLTWCWRIPSGRVESHAVTMATAGVAQRSITLLTFGDFAAPGFETEVRSDSPVVYYKFNEPTALALHRDRSGNGFDSGSVVGATFREPGLADSGVGTTVTGAGTQGGVTSAVGDLGTQDLSLEVVYKTTRTGEDQLVVTKWSGALLVNQWRMFLNTSDKLSVQIWTDTTGGGAVAGTVVDPDTTNDGEWHHAIATWGASDQTLRLYVDGVLKDSLFVAGTRIFAGTANLCTFSRGLTIGGRSVQGLDEFAVYNHVLSAARVTEHYNALLGWSGPLDVATLEETDTPQPLDVSTRVDVAALEETDSPQPLDVSTQVDVAALEETDTPQPLDVSTRVVLAALEETDTPQLPDVSTRDDVATLEETDSTQPLDVSTRVVLATLEETDTPQSLEETDTQIDVATLEETDSTQPLDVTTRVVLATLEETSTPQPLDVFTRAVLATLVETSTPQPLDVSTRVDVAALEETDSALGILVPIPVAPIIETSTVLPIELRHTLATLVEETRLRSFERTTILLPVIKEYDEAKTLDGFTGRREVAGSFGQINFVAYRYLPISVNIGYEDGSVESHEYRRATVNWGQRTTDAGVPIPRNDPRRP